MTSRENAKKEYNKFEISFEVIFKIFSASGGYKNNKERESNEKERNEESSSYLETIGGKSGTDDETFISSLDDLDTWNIIKFNKFTPTLELLYYKDSHTFTHCINLLKQYHLHGKIRKSQKYINIWNYASKLELDLLQQD